MANYTTPSQVRLRYCTIYSPGQETRAVTADDVAALKAGFDLVPYLQEINIYESIFDNTLSATLSLLENVGLPEHVPIVGAEVVRIGFSVTDATGKERMFDRGFRVVTLRDINFPRQNYRSYKLELATHEFVNSVSSRIARFFENKRCDQAVEDILSKDLKNRRPKFIEQTFGTFNTTIPNYTPLQAINYFTMLAQTNKTPRESNFLFYETLEGFRFESIYHMLMDGKTKPIPRFKMDPNLMTGSRAKPGTDEEARNAVFRLHQEQNFDLITDIQGGLLRSKMVHFDFLARKLAHEEDSRYTDTFGKTTHLAGNQFYPKNFDLSVSKNTRIFTFPSNIWSANSSYLKQIETTPVQNMWEAIVLRNRQLREIQHFSTLLDIPGNPDLRAGNLVDVRYPVSHALTGDGKSPSSSVKDVPSPYYSGNHLVTSVRHQFLITGSSIEYRMHLRACRDSVTKPLIGTTDTTGL